MPDWRDEIRRRLAAARLDPAREAEIAHELEQHLDDRYAELRAEGRAAGEASRIALAEIADDARMREELARTVAPAPILDPPGAAGGAPLATWWQDVRYALRMLRRTPAFTAVAVLTLAFGIGGTVAIFSAVYTVLYKPLPLAGSDALVIPVSMNPAREILRGSIPFADYIDWREQRDVFERVALFEPIDVDVSGGQTPERVAGVRVTEDYFETMQVQPLFGRTLIPLDHAADATRVAVISEDLWRRRFGADPTIVGQPMRLAGAPVTIAGVVAPARLWPPDTGVWLPMRTALLNDDVRTRRDNMIFLSIARLRDGVPLGQARARVAAIADRVAREHASSRTGWSTDLIPVREYVVEPELRLGMLVLMAGIGFVLLIACVNLANLLLARGTDRAREMAVRSALGASRTRLLRQLMTESVVLAVAGGAAGLLVARWLVGGLKTAAPAELPMVDALALDGTAAVVAAAVTIGTALVFGLLPAIAASSFRPADALREGGRTGSAGRRTGRLRETLVVAQIALAILLLTGAGLMLRTFAHLLRVDPGVDVERVLVGRLSLPARHRGEGASTQFFQRLTTALAASPGVEAAAATSFLPAGGAGYGLGRVFLLEGQPEPPASSDHDARWNVITPDYFRTLGIRVVRGRAFTAQDTAKSPPVMVINETMARRVFGNADPIGRRMRSWRDENVLREIVGVVSDVRYEGLADAERSLVYVPHAQDWWGLMIVAVRAQGSPAMLAETLRREVARLDPDIAVAGVATLESLAAQTIAPHRFGALLLGLFAGAAVLLAGIGVYGVMNYVVAQRSHEIGVRLALGARPRDAFRLVVGRGLLLAAIGATIGLAGAFTIGPVMESLLSGVDPRDSVTLATVPIVLGLVAFLGCALPGRRAARIEPIEALRL
jgi:putative ABC transport system permease protein